MEFKEVVKDLLFTFGVSGYEESIRKKIIDYLKNYGEPEIDKLGNVYLTIGSGERHIAFMAHMDEIGAVISYIEDSGFLKIKKLGGVDARILYGQVMEILTQHGKIVNGVIGLKPPHISKEDEMNKVIPVEDLYLDVGAKSKEDVKSMGINVLDPVRWVKQFHILRERYIVSRGLDDRAGCAILILLLDKLSKEHLKNKVTFIFTIQEETGLRGAKAIVEKDIDELYAIDSVTAADQPKVDYSLSPASLGNGPVFRFIDARGINSFELRMRARDIANKNKIPFQELATGGSTDAAGTFELGIPSLAICFPIRYTHTTVEMIDMEDINNEIKLLEKIVMD
ncbi:MAG: M42 family metallopeptidase [Thermoplasmata archaeon]|nr:M42 family metallopeptidase [Thermoplasmata archaeon]